jgi:NAD(P)H-dependent FMN reductase
MNKLHIIVGSTREGRAAETVAQWVSRRAKEYGGFDVTLLDLRDWPLPMFAETMATIGDFANPTYSEPIVRQWNRTIAEGDAFIFITPEYNHSFSGVLKNAMDSVIASWAFRNKPAAFVGYSAGIVGGARAVEQLALVTIEAEMVPLRNTVLVSAVQSAFDGTGQLTNPQSDVALAILLEDLAWWTDATVAARAAGELKPGALRFRALAAVS